MLILEDPVRLTAASAVGLGAPIWGAPRVRAAAASPFLRPLPESADDSLSDARVRIQTSGPKTCSKSFCDSIFLRLTLVTSLSLLFALELLRPLSFLRVFFFFFFFFFFSFSFSALSFALWSRRGKLPPWLPCAAWLARPQSLSSSPSSLLGPSSSASTPGHGASTLSEHDFPQRWTLRKSVGCPEIHFKSSSCSVPSPLHPFSSSNLQTVDSPTQLASCLPILSFHYQWKALH